MLYPAVGQRGTVLCVKKSMGGKPLGIPPRKAFLDSFTQFPVQFGEMCHRGAKQAGNGEFGDTSF